MWLFLFAAAFAGDLDDGAGTPMPAHSTFAPIPMGPQGVHDVVWARAFTLAQPIPYASQRGAPAMDRGVILELRVDPAMVVPRQVAPNLYVGDVPATLMNWDPIGGCAVVYVPGAPALATAPIYFGSAEPAERIDAAAGALERQAAVAGGATPLPQDRLDAAFAAGGAPFAARDFYDVAAAMGARIAACSPAEAERAQNMQNRPR